ncbi:hypothetical protein BpHYR1_048531 [Brachionus plicatilis]|uniref:RNA-binding protein n=1 Tax=Brachionus plicatilis TaxID=10195 RepID=A0A3M7Q6H5_BRAPC|nr:hypothetical protein BpHYR1_048531 [Brachionus plicatilis]
MAQHDIMISSITNEARAEQHLRELIEDKLQAYQLAVDIVWLNVHRSPSSVNTTYGFLRLSDSSQHQRIVELLNGVNHRNHQLNVKINPISTPSSRTKV